MRLRTLRQAFFLTLGLVLLQGLPSSLFAQEFFLKDGDRVVMMGDSITEQHLYSNYVEMWSVSRFPNWKLTFRNVGIGGDRSTGGNSRFKRDVLAYKPTVLTVDFGMNDGSYTEFKEGTFNPYIKGLQGIADQAKAAGIRVAWITPQPVEHQPGAKAEFYNNTLEKFSAGVKDIAAKNNGLFVDQFHPYWSVVKKARESGEKGRITGGDAVHPGPAGQALMAASILKGMGFPRQVASVTIAVGSDKALPGVNTKNCEVSDVATQPERVAFKQLDKALPFFPEEAKGILKWAPLLEEMNDYELKVTGLKAGKYEIRLDGKKVADSSSEELAKGVNLASAVLATGPIADQVKTVWTAVKNKNKYFHDDIFRGLILANAKSAAFKDVAPGDIEATRQKLYAERLQKMPELDAAVQKALVMQQHQVEIVAATK